VGCEATDRFGYFWTAGYYGQPLRSPSKYVFTSKLPSHPSYPPDLGLVIALAENPNFEYADQERKFGTLIIRQDKNKRKPLQFTTHRCCHSPASTAPVSFDFCCKGYRGPTIIFQRYHPTTPWRRAIESQFSKPFMHLKSRFHLYPCYLQQLAADELSETEATTMKRWWRTSGDWNPARACRRGMHLTLGSYRVCLIICNPRKAILYKQAECTHRNDV
jgi:hypothetical protein